MIPLWEKYPEIPFRSIGWRMGHGEAYAREWSEWFQRKTKAHRMKYYQDYPEPESWGGYYANIEKYCDQ